MEKLTKYEWVRLGSRGSINWDQLLNGETWRLIRGVDFDCSPHHRRNSIYLQAGRRGLHVRTHVDGDSLIVQAIPDSSGQEPSKKVRKGTKP